MNTLLNLRILGWLLVILGFVEFIPVATAIVCGEPVEPYLASALTTLVFGFALALGIQPENRRLRARDGFVVVTLGWILASLFGAIPYVATDTLSPVDALFESVAGFTTTGSTVMTRIEGSPHALLIWRSISQWLGGMGIIVFAVAILPLLGVGGMQLLKREMPGPSVEKVRPRVAAAARRMWGIYVGLTGAEFLALWIAGMGGFEALCHAFTTVSTGGFSTRDASIGGFASPAIEWIVIFFMLCGGINFVLHYRALTGGLRSSLGDSELRFYGWLMAGATAAVAFALWNQDAAAGHSLRAATFQVVSIGTTAGYTTADYEMWPALAQLVLLHLMVLGGMAGSTSGGIKTMRALLLLRALGSALSRLGHARAVPRPVLYGERLVSDETLAGVFAFVALYVLIAAVAAAGVAAADYDLTTSLSAALTAIGNVGPALGETGPFDNFAHFPASVKLGLALCMIAGRLELFTLVALLRIDFWRQ
ncbi:MAG: TrkH family potassium uptake protein [Deltaproteobacteria bacterium]|nr:MAG: TrkH family potassium uptake protein [Deltaproteobacteria bacterium]